MAKYKCKIQGNMDQLLSVIENGILEGSLSASLEDSCDYIINDVRCSIRVFERYSMLGKNRVSLNLTLLGYGENIYLTAITAGGSSAVFFKLNTFGEESFLEKIKEIVQRYEN
jgi:hypothetical protein